MTTKILFLLAAWILCTSSAWSQESIAAPFLYFQPSARANAMGGAAVAMERSSFEAFTNSAALVRAPKFVVSGSWQNPLPIFDRAHAYGSISYAFDSLQAVSLSGNYYSDGGHIRTFDNGSPGGSFRANSMLLTGTYSRALNNDISIGAGVSLLQVNLAPINSTPTSTGSASALLFNAGVLYRNIIPEATYTGENSDVAREFAHTGISVGISLATIGQAVKFSSAFPGDATPSTLTIGAAYSPLRTSSEGVQVGFDLEKRLQESGIVNRIHAGCEVNFLRYFCLRAGYNAGTASADPSFLTLGAGLRFTFLQVNVARYTRALLPTWQFGASFILE
jgi:hypothetical protein